MKKGVVIASGFLLVSVAAAQPPAPGATQGTPSTSSMKQESAAPRSTPPSSARQTAAHHFGVASWYGEDHRGRLMANGQRFDPDKLTAASWFYPLGTRVRVSLKQHPRVLNPPPPRSVVVTITDRGPAHRLVRGGRIIDLSHAVFRRLADPDVGLVEVVVTPELRPAQSPVRSPG